MITQEQVRQRMQAKGLGLLEAKRELEKEQLLAKVQDAQDLDDLKWLLRYLIERMF